MVTNTALATVCIESGLAKYLLQDSETLTIQIDAFEKELTKARNDEYELARDEGRMPGQYWVDVEPPKVRFRSSFQ